MFNVLGDINWLAVLLAFVALSVLGGVWFAALFAKPYAEALGNDPSKKPKMSPSLLIGQMAATLITVVASAILLEALNITTYSDAFVLSLIIGVGFLAAMTLNIAINPNFPRPYRYTLINAPFFVIGSIIAVSILFILQKV